MGGGGGALLTHPLFSVDCLANTARYPQSSRAGLQSRLLSSLSPPDSSVFHILFFLSICPPDSPCSCLEGGCCCPPGRWFPTSSPNPQPGFLHPGGRDLEGDLLDVWSLCIFNPTSDGLLLGLHECKGASTSGIRSALVQVHTPMMAKVCKQFKNKNKSSYYLEII